MIYDKNVTWKDKVKNIDDGGCQAYKLLLKCDECENIWSTCVSNYHNRKNIRPDSLDLCKFCRRKGERNASFGKDRSVVLAYARTFQQVNGMSGRHHSVETRALQSKSKVDLIAEGKFDIKSCNRGRKAYYVSTKSKIQFHADSILELARMIELDKDATIASWTKLHGIRIPYSFEGTDHNYVPDFLLQDIHGITILEEVKGRKEPIDIAKEQQAIIYCDNNNYVYRMIMGKDLQDPSNYKKLLKETKQ